jgi:hypothetical protein
MIQKAERFAPGAGKKYRLKSDSDYSAALTAGNTERDSVPEPTTAPATTAPATTAPATTAPATPAATTDEDAG